MTAGLASVISAGGSSDFISNSGGDLKKAMKKKAIIHIIVAETKIPVRYQADKRSSRKVEEIVIQEGELDEVLQLLLRGVVHNELVLHKV